MNDAGRAATEMPDSGPSSLPIRVFQTFVSPGRLFEDLRGEPRAVAAIALGAILVGLANAMIPLELWEQVIRDQLISSGQELPDDLAGTARFAKWAATIGPVVFWPILTLLVAAVNALVFLVGLGYQGRYQAYLSVTAHALIVGALGTVALTPVRIFTEDVQLVLTVGAFLPDLEVGLLARMMRYLDLFNLWASSLIGLAASIIDGKKGAAVSIVFALGASLLIALSLAAAIA